MDFSCKIIHDLASSSIMMSPGFSVNFFKSKITYDLEDYQMRRITLNLIMQNVV